MWRKLLSFLMYVYLVVGLIAVLSIGISLIVYGGSHRNSHTMTWGIEVLAIGIPVLLFSCAAIGACLEMMKNIEKISRSVDALNEKSNSVQQPQQVIHVWPKEAAEIQNSSEYSEKNETDTDTESQNTAGGWYCECGSHNGEDDLFCENCGRKRVN